MRIAIMTDLHVGYTGESRWHNRKMWTEAPEVARAAVAQINRLGVDRVVVSGDLTESGEPAELATVKTILDALSSEWFVLPGNHDRKALAAGTFDQFFAEHLPPLYAESEGIGSLFLRESWPREDKNVARLNWDLLEPQLEAILAAPPRLLTIFAHFPLLPEQAFAEAHAGLYAGCYIDGEAVLRRLQPALSGRIAVFCGHQHWHHLMPGSDILHCTTASLIEYPMECRLVTLTTDHLSIETLDSASPTIASASLDAASWVSGEDSDRAYQTSIPFTVKA
ncbi:MAG: hypothetical protein GC204_15910 [Chloroflexi bacterium]|nr:hypothetical protein [Chloroflexota bacterium]